MTEEAIEKIKQDAETLIQKHQQCWTMKIGSIKSSSWVIKVKRFDNFVKDVLKILEGKVVVSEQQIQELANLLKNRIETANEYGEIAVRDGMTQKTFLESILKKFVELFDLDTKKETSK